MSKQSPTQTRRAPGVLRALPETLPFYPYCRTNSKPLRLKKKAKKQKDIDAELDDDESDTIIANKPLLSATDILNRFGFTLFFFVDSTNRQCLSAIPKVSQWCHYALKVFNSDGRIGNYSRVICIPNNSSPHEINMSSTTSDPIMQANINSSLTSSVSKQQQGMAMLQKTGFYHLPFLHPKRQALLHLLGANRVPSIIVVDNRFGTIITRYGWEAIEREISKLDQYIESNWIESKKDIDEDISNHFESEVVRAWGEGKSGLPLWWTLFGWIM